MTATDDPTAGSGKRRPSAFDVTDRESAKKAEQQTPPRKPQSFSGPVELTPDEEDPFLGAEVPSVVIKPAKPRLTLGSIAA